MKMAPSTMSSQASTGKSSQVQCFKCKKDGHKSYECPNTKVMILMDNGEYEEMSEGEYEALKQVALQQQEESDHGEEYCEHDTSPSLVVTRVLTSNYQHEEDQRCTLFQTRARINKSHH
jgi:hypothetical protein